MPWCAVCKKEYPKGTITCKSCNAELVEKSDVYNYEAVAYVEEEIADRLVKLLQFSEIPEAVKVYDSLNKSYEIQVDRGHYKKASDLVRIFRENEFDANYEEDAEFGDHEYYEETQELPVSAYVKTKDRYQDNLSSAYTFLVCGICGIILLILEDLNIIKLLGVTGMSKIMLNVVIGGLFVGFVFIGLYSLKYSKSLKEKAQKEEEFTDKIMDWLRAELPKEFIEDTIDNSIPDAAKYFSRIEIIRTKVEGQYSSLDDEYLIKISEDYYNEIYS